MLKRRRRQSLRLDHGSRQILASKLNVLLNLPILSVDNVSPANNTSLRSARSASIQRSCSSSRSIRKSPTTKLFRRKSHISFHYGPPGAFLPVELLLRIFAIGAEGDGELPVVVSQVCSMWRRITTRTPGLWSHIRLDGRDNLCLKCIQRSRGRPLDIELVFCSPSPSQPSAFHKVTNAHQRMASVLPIIEQWRSFTIHFDDYAPFFWNLVLSGLCVEPMRSSSHAPQLEALSLIYPLNDDSKEFHLFGDCAPKLRDVVLLGIRLRWTAPLFANLVSLEYTHHGFTVGQEAVYELLTMLRVSKHLELFAVTFPGYIASTGSVISSAWHSHAYTSVTLHCLKTLVLRADSETVPPRELKMLATKLVVPSLTTLRLVALNSTAGFSRKAVSAVLKPFRRHAAIERVEILNGWNHQRCITAFVRSLPSMLCLNAKQDSN